MNTALGLVQLLLMIFKEKETDSLSYNLIFFSLCLCELKLVCPFYQWKRVQRMSTQPKSVDVPTQAADDQQEGSPTAVGLGGKIIEQYRKTKEHAETYPYVWASYILVYGGFGLWLTYRWRALRKTEDRVRALQEILRKQVEAEELAAKSSNQSVKSASSAKKGPASPDKAAK